MEKTLCMKSCVAGMLFVIILTSSIQAATVATPVFTPDGGTYNTEQNVIITCATPGAMICYTLDGSDPNTEAVYDPNIPIVIDHSLTLKAKAWKGAMTPSSVKSAIYNLVVSTPIFTPAGGMYETDQTVVITCDTPGTVIRYTIDGSDPNEGIIIANGGGVMVTVNPLTFLKAKAFKDGWTYSSVKTAVYYHYAGGSGTVEDPYQINSSGILLGLVANPSHYNKCFILTDDIDLNGQVFNTAIIAPDTDGSTWDFQGVAFTGTFDGNSYTITNFTIDSGCNEYLGLFGCVGSGGEIKNLNIKNFLITGNWYVGGLTGYNDHGSISNCNSSGTASGFRFIGGLIGKNFYGFIANCYSAGNISGAEYLGGLVGVNSYTGINDCFSTVNIDGLYAFNSYSGGLIGTNSYADISNCYSTGSVKGDFPVGGLIGLHYVGTISNCYSTGFVACSFPAGGFIGAISQDNGIIQNSFWDIQTSDKTVGVGQGSSNGVTGKTTAQMKTLSTFTSAGWDFATIWDICETTNYPRLQWQIPETDWVCPDGVNLEDLDYFVTQWLENDCDSSNDYCDGVDIDTSGKVDLEDFAIFAQSWLEI